MDYIPSIIAAIVLIGILIMVHELGHYLAGRLLKLPVVEFAIGMGPKIISFVRNGIRYSLRAFPLGGFCAYNGEDSGDETEKIKPDAPSLPSQRRDWRSIPLAERNLNDCPAWRRLVMQFSGVAMNFAAAYLCTILLLCVIGLPISMNRISEIAPESPAEQAGLQKGDVILKINGSAENDISTVISENPQEPLTLTIQRGEEELTLTATPKYFDDTDSYRLGFTRGAVYQTMPLGDSVVRSGAVMIDITKETYSALFGLLRGQGTNEVTGVVGTVYYMADQTSSYFTESTRSGFFMLTQLAIILSLNLGIVNLLPLPALDGGRIVFTLIEMIFRRPVPRKIEAWIHAAGFVLLMGLMVLLLFKDISSIISGIGGGS